ncbi:hypothetical protein CGCVW01_v012588 [Colletotrichum viniferum]|nr:hypothetical protein CGCVW01_v012588 [Colletotrichum viniferum]
MLLGSLLFAIASFSRASANPAKRSFEEYGIEDFQWEIEAFSNQPPVPINGSIEEVHAKILELNPNYDVELAGFGWAQSEEEEEEASLDKRTDFSGSKYMCDSRTWAPCFTRRIRDGISHLRRTGGKPKNGPGPGNCGRVSCSGQSAIWWCNDDRNSKELAAFGSIADGAQYLVDRCPYGAGNRYMAGQVFHSTNWNVIVRQDNNNCGTYAETDSG